MPHDDERFAQLAARSHLPALDGLRAVAVANVMAYHFGVLPFGYGRYGVTLFFVLSGFLITTLLLREHAGTGDVSLRRFYARRALRIVPAYFAFLAVSFAVMTWLEAPPGVPLVAFAATYLLNYGLALGLVPDSLISHGWSLAVEEQFYLLWPAILLMFAGSRRGLRLVVLVLLCAVALWRTLVVWHGVDGYVYFAFDTRLDSLLVGCGLAVCAADRWVQDLARLVSRLLLPFATVLLLRWSGLVSIEYNSTLGYTVESLLLALLLVQVMVMHDRTPWRWLDARGMRYLGAISYPMYLYHVLAAALVRELVDLPAWAFALTSTALTLVLAALSYHLLEQRFLRLKRQWEVVPTAAT